MVGGQGADRRKDAWTQVYRALDHGVARNACKDGLIQRFPRSIEDFANLFVQMQSKRHAADYDPSARFAKSGVLQDIASVEAAIRAFRTESARERRAFCAFVLFRKRVA